MADYTINIGFNDNNAGKKLDDLDKQVKEVTKPAKIDIKLPDLEKAKKNLQELSKYSSVAVAAFKQFTPVGQSFAAVEGSAKALSGSLANVGRTLGNLSVYVNPVRGLADGFGSVTTAVQGTIDSTARLGFAIFGVTQSVNVLKAAFGQMFEDTVGREVNLRDQILQTATTLAGTNRIFADGFEIKDPIEKLKVLEGSVNKSIERIRDKSLEIAGTTSEAMIGVFNIVASQIGSFGGTLPQAEDLAAKFSGALGTLGMSDPMYARQEIGSVMMGNIGPDSVLAKTLNISNADIQKAKEQGKLYEYLTDKLAIFEAGQKQAARGFRGITSNIQELSEELKRSFGASLLDPILKRISAFYDKFSGKDTLLKLKQTAQAFGQLVGGSLNSAYGTISGSSIFKRFDSKGIQEAANKLQAVFAKIAVFIQNVLSRIAPSVQSIIDRVGQSVVVLGKAFAEMAGTLARVKIDQLVVRLQALTALTPGIVVAANAYADYLKTLEDIINTPIGRYINEVKEMNKVLSEFGVFGVINNIIAVKELKQQIPILVSQIQAIGAAIGQAAQTAFTFVGNLYGRIATATIRTIVAIEGPIVGLFTKISLGLARIAVQAAQFTLTLSNVAVIIGGQWAALSAPLASLSNGLAGIATALSRAGLNAAQFGAEVQAAMTQAQASTQNAASAINVLGVRLKTGVQAGAATAAGALTGLVKGFLATMTTMALWTAGLTLVFDLLRRVGEWWERFSQQQSYKQAVDDLNSGLLDQVKAATAAGKALDSVTEARKRLREEALQAQIAQDEGALKELAKELYKRTQNIEALRKNFPAGSPGATGPDSKLTNEQYIFKRDPGFAKELKEVEERLKNANKLLRQLRGESEPTDKNDTQLRQQENRQQIEDLAKFEKETRRSVEDEIYNYRRQVQQKELEVFRTQGDLRLQQVDQQNRRLIEGVDSEARASLEALNNWLSTKRKGELDLEVKKREAQMAATEVERAIGRFRLQLEQQVAEIRKRIQQYEIDVLDKRIKAEQLIANIRNGVIISEPQGGGQFRVGSTGRSTGPHLHIGGSDADKVIEEAMTIIKAWQKMGVEYIKLSNVKADVTKVSDDNKLRNLLRQEMAVHGTRSGNNPVDIAVPAGTPLPVAHGPVTWGGANEGYRSTSVTTGNFFLHGLKPEVGTSNATGAAPGTRQARDFRESYLMRMSNLEGGYGVNGSSAKNPSSSARGYFQLIPSTEQWLRSSGKAGIADGMLSTDFNTAAQAAYQYAIMMRPAAQQLFAQGDTAGLDRLLNRLWTSLPGGAEEATGQRLARGNAFLKGGGATGSASLASVGGAPAKPNVMLNIDTSELDTAAQKLKDANQQLIELQNNQNALNDADAFNNFVKSLDTTSLDLEKINKQIKNQQINLEAIAVATKDGIYDPATLEVNVQYQQALAALDALRRTQIETLSKLGNATDQDRLRAETSINAMYEKNKKNLEDILNKKLQALNLDKEVERLTQINADRRQAQRDLKSESSRLQSEARSIRISPDDFRSLRREQALQQIQEKYLALTDGDTKSLTETVKAAFEKEKEQLLANAESLAALDAVVDESRRIREIQNQIEQTRIDRLSSEATARTEAAKAGLNSSNFQGLRRLDAEQQIYSKYIELSKGGVKELTRDEQMQLQRLAEESLTTADALAKVDMELNRFAQRLDLARQSAQTLTEGYKGMLTEVMNGGDLKEAMSEMGQNVTSFFTGKLLDYAFKPLEDQLEQAFRKLLGVDDAQTKNIIALNTLTTAINTLNTTLQAAPVTRSRLFTTPETGAKTIDTGAAHTTSQGLNEIGQVTDELATKVDNNAKQTSQGIDSILSSMQKYTAGLAGVATSALTMIGGIQMMKKGGTFNTLMGIASAFGSVASFTGMFGKGGIFARASGGPVLSRRPYLVGERGPELFMPHSSGTVIPNSRTEALLASRGALASPPSSGDPDLNPFDASREALGDAAPFSANREAIATAAAVTRERQTDRALTLALTAPPKPMDVRYESRVINSTEYVSAEQFRQGLRDAAERGRAMTLSSLRNSVKTRRSVGI